MNQLQRKLFSRVLMNQAAGDGGGSGGGGSPAATGATPDDLAKQIREAVDKEVAGLKANNAQLLQEKKQFQDQLKAFDGIDPIKTKELLARIEGDAEAKMISEGKMDEVLQRRTERLRADYDKKLADAVATAEAAQKRAQAYQGRVLDDAIRAAAAKAGVHTHAVDDALFRARTLFALNDDGQAVAIGKDGQPLLGRDGKTELTPSEWLESMKESAPHWFPAGSSGGGASGDPQGQASGAKTMKRAAFERLGPQEKIEFAKGGGKLID